MFRASILFLFTTTLAPADEFRPVSGRIEHADSPGTCGAVLLDPDLILTAAHCVDPRRVGSSFRPAGAEDLRFLEAVHRHPAHGLGQSPSGGFRFDIAVARLDPPVRRVPSLPIGAPAALGEKLFVETWRRGEAGPGRMDCPVVRVDDGLSTLDCSVTGGHSGAPVLRIVAGEPELVAVIVATLTLNDRPAALAVEVDRHAATLRSLAGRD